MVKSKLSDLTYVIKLNTGRTEYIVKLTTLRGMKHDWMSWLRKSQSWSNVKPSWKQKLRLMIQLRMSLNLCMITR